MANTKKILAITCSVIGIIAGGVTIINQLRSREINWIESHIKLTETQHNSNLKGNTYSISGHVKFNPNSQLFMDLELFPLVQTISNGNWWVQPRPLVNPTNGNFKGIVFIGDSRGNGVGENFHIAVIAVPKGTLKVGDKLHQAPVAVASSNIVNIMRIK